MLDEETEIELEYQDRNGEYIASAFNALSAIQMLDTGLMNEEERHQIKTIQFQAINIISESLNNIYEEIFDTSVYDDDDLVL